MSTAGGNEDDTTTTDTATLSPSASNENMSPKRLSVNLTSAGGVGLRRMEHTNSYENLRALNHGRHHINSFDNIASLTRTRSVVINDHPFNQRGSQKLKRQEVLEIRKELEQRKENFESVDFFATIPTTDNEDDDEDDEEDDDEDDRSQKPTDNDDTNEEGAGVEQKDQFLDLDTFLKKRKSIWKKIWKRISNFISFILYPVRKLTSPTEVKALIFLSILGLLAAFANFFTDIFISKIDQARMKFTTLTPSFAANYILYTLFSVIFAVFASFCVHFISPTAGGSGIPELKSILSGNSMERYLDARTLAAKTLGLIATASSGLCLGRLGPFVQISACIANLLMKIKFFKKLKKAEYEKNSLLAAACATGVATAFGSPFGGVLFSIEVTSTYYPVNNLVRCIYCTLFGSLFFYVSRKLGIYGGAKSNLFSTDFAPFPYQIHEIFFFVVVGIICGLGGAFFNFILTKMVQFRMTLDLIRARRYLLIGSVSIITALVSFPIDPLLRASANTSVNVLFSQHELSSGSYPVLQLTMAIIAKFLLTPMAAILPVPGGLFAPVFAIGALIGRLFGEITRATLFPEIIPAYYAVVGASSLASGVTRSLSTIVIVFELTGQLSLMIPIMISNIVAVGVANLFNESIYDRLILLRGLPYLNELRSVGSHKMKASDIMRDKVHFIATSMSPAEVVEYVYKYQHAIYPVVDNPLSKILIGSVSRENILNMERSYETFLKIEKKAAANEPEKITVSPKNTLSRRRRRQRVKSIDITDIQDLEEPPNTETVTLGSFTTTVTDTEPQLIFKKDNREFYMPFDPSPLSITIFTPLTKLHFLFSMLRLSHIWVTAGGKLQGVVVKKDLIDAKL